MQFESLHEVVNFEPKESSPDKQHSPIAEEQEEQSQMKSQIEECQSPPSEEMEEDKKQEYNSQNLI